MSPRHDPVLFDLDGMLTASGPGVVASVRHALGPPLADSFRDVCA